MPIEVEVDGLPDLLEFDDGTPDDVIQRVVKEQVARKNFYSDVASEQERARGSILTKAASAELSAIEAVEPVLGRISLGGISRMAGAIAKDVLSPGIPGIPTPRATAAELMGQETPADIQAGIQESVVKQGLVAAAETVPVVGAAMLTAPVLAPGMIGAAASGALALGASAAEESGGEVYPTFKGTVIGAALPGLGAIGRGAAARVTGALVNQGATAFSNPVVQRAIEAGAAQVPIQAVMLGDLMASPEYRQSNPDERDRMLAVHAISNIPYGIPDAVQAFRGGAPLANEFETPAVWEARRLAGDKPLTAQAIIDAEALLKTADPNRTDPLSIVPTEEQPSAPITGVSDAIQEQGTDASLLRQKRSALGLRGVAEETAPVPQENVGQEQPAQAAGRLTPEEQVLAQEELGEATDRGPDIASQLRGEGVSPELAADLLAGRKTPEQVVDAQLGVIRQRGRLDAKTIIVEENPDGSRSIGFSPDAGVAASSPRNIGSMSHEDAIIMARESAVQRVRDIISGTDPFLTDDPVREYEMSLIPGGRQFAQAISQAIAIGRRRRAAGVAQAPVAPGPAGAPQDQPATAPQAGASPEAGASPPRRLKTVEDVKQIFIEERKPLPSLGKMLKEGAETFRRGVLAEYRPFGRTQEDLESYYKLPRAERRLDDYMETLAGVGGQADVDKMRFHEAIDPIRRGIREDDLDTYIFAKRAQDRLRDDPVTKRVEGYEMADVDNVLNQLQIRLGPDGWAKLQQVGGIYNEFGDIALRSQVEAGNISLETYTKIKESNHFYAPFGVLDKLQKLGDLPPGVGRQIDTQAELAKPITGIYEPNFKLGSMIPMMERHIEIARVLAEKNKRMKALTALSQDDPQGLFVRRLGKDEEPAKGKASVVVKEDGEPVHYEVDATLADAVKNNNKTVNETLAQILRVTSIPFKAGTTSANIIFQLFSAKADQKRLMLMSKHGINSPLDVYRYPLDFMEGLWGALSLNRIIPGVKASKLARDFLESGAAASTMQSQITPDAVRYRPPASVMNLAAQTRNILESPARIGQVQEQVAKMISTKRAMRLTGAKTGKELAERFSPSVTETRRFGGNPDYSRAGTWDRKFLLNYLFTFSRARLQGTAADMGRLIGADGGKTAAKTWVKLGLGGIGTVMAWINNHRDENVDDYNQLTEQEKRNYTMYPKDTYIINSEGKRVRDYWREPKRDTDKLIANGIEAAMDWWNDRDPEGVRDFAVHMVEDLAPVNVTGKNLDERMESVISSTHPWLKGSVEAFTKRDTYLHRGLITDPRQIGGSATNQFTKGTAEIFKKIANNVHAVAPEWAPTILQSPKRLENLTKNLTGQLITQFLPAREIEGRTGWEANRFLKRLQTTGFVEGDPKFKERFEELQRQQFDESLKRERDAESILKNNTNDRVKSHQEARKTRDKRLVDRVDEMVRAKAAGVTREDQQMLQLAPRQRAQLILEQMSEMDQTNSHNYLRVLRKRRVLSDDTRTELNILRRALKGEGSAEKAALDAYNERSGTNK